jgi:predicted HicB family RNase H-like nuclease
LTRWPTSENLVLHPRRLSSSSNTRSIHFEGRTATELERAFRASIDSYLELCAETSQQPDRPFNGKILVRTEPELHRKAALRAAVEGVSLSRWISRQIESAP